jgi:hypothetical protein
MPGLCNATGRFRFWVRLPLSLALIPTAGACATGAGGPVVLSMADLRAPAVRVGEWITGYDSAVVSIAAIMERDLSLPDVQATLYFYSDRDAFSEALREHGYDEAFARDAAATLSGIGGFRRVLLNDATLRWLEWPQRIALLAHELTHTVQYEFSGGRRGTSEQWLREGFAEWVEVHVLDVLGLTTWAEARRLAAERVRDAARRRAPPALAEMVTYPDWVRLIQREGAEEAVYAQALMAADLLIERRGLPAVLAYFRAFRESEDRLGHFRRAFGEDLSGFEAVFRERLDRAVR